MLEEQELKSFYFKIPLGYKHPYRLWDKYTKCLRCEKAFYVKIKTEGQYRCPHCHKIHNISKK